MRVASTAGRWTLVRLIADAIPQTLNAYWHDRAEPAGIGRDLDTHSPLWRDIRIKIHRRARCSVQRSMQKIKDATSEFLAHKRVAVTGVSRHAGSHGSNVVYQRLRSRGYETFAVNPNADMVEGDTCYPDIRSIPGGGGVGRHRHQA